MCLGPVSEPLFSPRQGAAPSSSLPGSSHGDTRCCLLLGHSSPHRSLHSLDSHVSLLHLTPFDVFPGAADHTKSPVFHPALGDPDE